MVLVQVAHTLQLLVQVLASFATLGRHHQVETLHVLSAQLGHTLNSCLPNVLPAYPELSLALVLEDAHSVKQEQLPVLVPRNAIAAQPEDIQMPEGLFVNHVNPVLTPRHKHLDALTAVQDLSLELKPKSVNCANQVHSQATAQANAPTVQLGFLPRMQGHQIGANLAVEGPTQVKQQSNAVTALRTHTQNLVPRSV